MAILSIYDVSGAIYKASGTPGLNTVVKGSIPFGGVEYVIRSIISDIARKYEVTLAFDSKSFRKEISGQYKKGRVKRPDIWVQLDILKELFDMTEIPYMKKDGYEADDLIFSCCQYWDRPGFNIHQIKTKIRINSTDLDLVHNVSDSGVVEFKGYTSQVPDIANKSQYESLYSGKLKYNTKTFYNILFGDSDYKEVDDNGKKIPFKLESGVTGKQIYERACMIIDKYNISGNNSRTPAFVDKVIATFNPTPNDLERVNKLKKIFFPVLVKDANFVTITKDMVLSKPFARMIAGIRIPSLTRLYINVVNDQCFIQSQAQELISILDSPMYRIDSKNSEWGAYDLGKDPYGELFKEYDRKYSKGSYMVDNNLSVNSVETEDSGIVMSEFLNIL